MDAWWARPARGPDRRIGELEGDDAVAATRGRAPRAPRAPGSGTRTGAPSRPAITAAQARALQQLLTAAADAGHSHAASATTRAVTGRPSTRLPAARAARARKAARSAARRARLRRWSGRDVLLAGAAALITAAIVVLLPAEVPAPPATTPTRAASLALAAQTSLLDAAGR
jgi:hypothetical protein